MKPELLLQRLEEVGASLAATGEGVALIGLGSVGQEMARLDRHSDLDFFAIVQPGAKARFLEDVGWLAAPCPIAYRFRNTVDGYKYLYEDGIFCEMAVFEEAELASIPFVAGRVVWKAEGVAEDIARPPCPVPARGERSEEWLLGEAVTCLYVGLQRFHRGEKLSAQRFIQHYAVDRLLELWERQTGPASGPRDPFAVERRIEQRHPALAARLPAFVPGYEGSRTAARAILDFLDEGWGLNRTMRDHVLALCEARD